MSKFLWELMLTISAFIPAPSQGRRESTGEDGKPIASYLLGKGDSGGVAQRHKPSVPTLQHQQSWRNITPPLTTVPQALLPPKGMTW